MELAHDSLELAYNRIQSVKHLDRQGLVFYLFVWVPPPTTVDGSESGNGGYDEGHSVKTMNLERNGGWETERKGSFFQTTFSW